MRPRLLWTSSNSALVTSYQCNLSEIQTPRLEVVLIPISLGPSEMQAHRVYDIKCVRPKEDIYSNLYVLTIVCVSLGGLSQTGCMLCPKRVEL